LLCAQSAALAMKCPGSPASFALSKGHPLIETGFAERSHSKNTLD